ncbi:MAG: SDR family oxidoreductase [Leptolyngbya sp.]|nr:SDR family oxidoreductase [Leptolyngbya sp.]
MDNSPRSDLLRRALITGASRGIGRATAHALAQAGYDVALLGRSLERLQPVVDEMAEYGVVAKGYAIELADIPQVQPRMVEIIEDFGPFSVLINNAGMGYTGSLATTPLHHWQQVMDLNLTSIFQCIQAALPTLRSGGGTIVNISSIAAKSAFPDWGAYSVSKAGLVSLSKVLAVEERAHGIRVVMVTPGSVNTPLWDTDTVHADFDRSQMLTPELVAQTILSTILLPTYAVIEDIVLMPAGGAL